MVAASARTTPPQVLESSLVRKRYAPVYLFSGEEDFLVEEAIDQLIDQALDESVSSFNLDIVYGADVDARRIVALASAYPMMSERRVVIVREFDRLSEKEPLIPYIENPLQSTSLVVISPKPDFRLKVFKAIDANGTIVTFHQLFEDKIPAWIGKRVGEYGKKATPEACQMIGDHVGKSLRAIQNELDKLFIYIGDKLAIDADDVASVVGMSKQFNIFELQNAIGEKNLARSMSIMEYMLNAGESPIGIIVMLTRYFQKLWLLQELKTQNKSRYDLAKFLKVNPNNITLMNHYLQAVQKYDGAEIERVFGTLIATDEALKSSGGDEKLLMTLLLYKIHRREMLMAEV